MNEVLVTVVGNLTGDPVLNENPDGSKRATFGLAHTPRRREPDGTWGNGDTTYYQVTCWRALGENAAHSLRKGDPVLVRGTLKNRSWNTEGRSGSTLELSADAVGPDLSRGTSMFRRTARQQPAGEAAAPGGEGAQSWTSDEQAGAADLPGQLRAPDTVESLTALDAPGF
ncbi:single-strand DNA-binding protein [Motilibacter peucedani]|uniref:Single-stranded DNA-binding protein n=1 Tax=Motilibacter peucedani TaxID=598650 RepID=A0A420XNP2_9ACTN|nr:single-stranded DNA-binding protein [Motilibacter peucedani]RKS73796.1 single-strand DNA-binding protein [Motilibacter peucedani]